MRTRSLLFLCFAIVISCSSWPNYDEIATDKYPCGKFDSGDLAARQVGMGATQAEAEADAKAKACSDAKANVEAIIARPCNDDCRAKANLMEPSSYDAKLDTPAPYLGTDGKWYAYATCAYRVSFECVRRT